MKYRYLSGATTRPSQGRNDRFLRQTLVIATAIFLSLAPWPDALDIAEITAGYISG
jgi:hypothetical protein